MKRLSTVVFLVITFSACARQEHRAMVHAEKVLQASTERWDAHVTAEIERCRALDLPTPGDRRNCLGPIPAVQEVVEPAVSASVALLRAYWLAVAADAPASDRHKLIAELRTAVSTLPPEHFAGLLKLLHARKGKPQ